MTDILKCPNTTLSLRGCSVKGFRIYHGKTFLDSAVLE